ncbi:MAG: tetratricopeptide repeat protein, partial [Planctomycetota bacterium]
AKEMVVTLPAVVCALELCRRPRLEWRRVACHVAFWAIACWFIYVTVSNEKLIAAPVGGESSSTLLTVPRYIFRYLGLVLFPLSQSLDYSFDVIPASTGAFAPPATLFALLGVLALSAATLFAVFKKRVALGWGLSWFLVGLTPVLQFVPIPERFAERFAYLPSIGICLAFGVLFTKLQRSRPKLAIAAFTGIAISLGSATIARNGDWTSRLTIWEAAVHAQPRCARAHLAYGNALRESGSFAEAEQHYTRALELWAEVKEPSSLQRGQALQATMFRGGVNALLGERDVTRLNDAVTDLRQVLASTDTDGKEIESSPEFVVVHKELASVLLKLNDREGAAREFERIVEIGEPVSRVAEAHYWLGKIAIMEQDIARAVVKFREALASLPKGDPSLYGVSVELADMLSNLEEDHDRAWTILQDLLESSPPDDVRVAILLRQAQILDRKGEIQAAVDRLEEALSIDKDSDPVLLTLAGIEGNLGRYESAIERYQQVLRKYPKHAAAHEGLKALLVRQRMGDQKETKEDENAEVLRGLVSRARKHAEKSELIAAREIYHQLLRTAGQLGEDEGVAIAYCGIAAMEELLGRPSVAWKNYQRAENAIPNRTETLLQMAGYQLRFGDPSTAKDAYVRYFDSLGEGKPDVWAAFNLGDLYTEGDPKSALKYFRLARELGVEKKLGDKGYALDRRIGELELALGKYRDAYTSLQRYVKNAESKEPQTAARIIRLIEDKVLPGMVEEEFEEKP